jgi:propionate CoA-transferase
VQQVTFSGPVAASKGQRVLYVTERCVFELGPSGLRLVEVAPGIDVERDILARMAFRPEVADPLRRMDPRIARPRPMGLLDVLLDLKLSDRLGYDAERDTLFANFEGLSIRSAADVETVRRVFEALCRRIGRKVALVVNYDGFSIDETVADAYFEMVADLQARYYSTAVRYTTSAFMRMKLGAELQARRSASHVFESRSEAVAFAAEHQTPMA